MNKFFTHNGTQQQGPYDIADLEEQKIDKDTLIWHEGINEWTKANDIPELQSLFTKTPPPLSTKNEQSLTNSTQTNNWRKWIAWVVVGVISLILTFATKGVALAIILPAIGLYFVWKKIGGLKIFSILSLIMSIVGIIGGLGFAFYASQELRYDIVNLRQIFLAIGVVVAMYSIYFLAYSITVLASVKKQKTPKQQNH